MMKNYKLKISYDGTRYYGWEHQPDKETIQGKLEMVLSRMVDVPVDAIDIIGAGRTDAGVHARAMVANVHLDTRMSPEEILTYMNRYLPDDIAVLEVKEASERFHARYKAVGKTYRYTCFDGLVRPVFDRKYYTPIEQTLDVGKMQQAAAFLQGEHDFKSFCGNSRMKKSTVRIVDEITIKRSKGYVYLTFHGTGFLQNMVRIMTGTLLEVGLGRMEPEQVKEILEAQDRKVAGPTAPAKGLCLMKVDY
jgi:tRNA pseudouridine38-40 synthase